MGAKLGDCGPSSVCFAVWIAERRERCEAMIVHENTEDFDSDRIADALRDTHRVMYFKLDPRHLGYPQRRPRKITIAIRNDYYLSIPLEQFVDIMGRSVCMTPEAFFVMGGEGSSTDEYEAAEKACTSKKRKLYSGGCPSLPWKDYLLPLHRECLEDYKKAADECKCQHTISCRLHAGCVLSLRRWSPCFRQRVQFFIRMHYNVFCVQMFLCFCTGL